MVDDTVNHCVEQRDDIAECDVVIFADRSSECIVDGYVVGFNVGVVVTVGVSVAVSLIVGHDICRC